jgi:hypothetical protein
MEVGAIVPGFSCLSWLIPKENSATSAAVWLVAKNLARKFAADVDNWFHAQLHGSLTT